VPQVVRQPYQDLSIAMTTQEQLFLPVPIGQHAASYSTTKLIDETRTDPYDPDNGKRVVMVSLFHAI